MKIRIAIVALVVALAPTFASASSAVSGAVNFVGGHSNDGTYDSKAGFTFEVGNSATLSATTGKYCILWTDGASGSNASDEISLILSAFLLGQTVTFSDTGTTAASCGGLERAVGPYLGTLY